MVLMRGRILVYRADLPLRGFDEDIRAAYAEAAEARGIILHPGTSISSVSADDTEKVITLENGQVIRADTLMAAQAASQTHQGWALPKPVLSLMMPVLSVSMMTARRRCHRSMPSVM